MVAQLPAARKLKSYLSALELLQRRRMLFHGCLPPEMSKVEARRYFRSVELPLYEYFCGGSAISNTKPTRVCGKRRKLVDVFAGNDDNGFCREVMMQKHPQIEAFLSGDYRSVPKEHLCLAAWAHGSPPCQPLHEYRG